MTDLISANAEAHAETRAYIEPKKEWLWPTLSWNI